MLLSVSVVCLLVFAACGDAGDAEPSSTTSTPTSSSPTTTPPAGGSAADLVGTSWIVDEFTVDGVEFALVPNADPTIVFSAESPDISGTTGCNSYFASVEYPADGELRIGGVGQTEMACFPDEVMAQEARFTQALSGVTFYELVGERLTLVSDDGSIIISAVNRESVEVPVELGDVLWIADTRIEREAAMTLVTGTEVTLSFDTERGNIGGHSGCNQFGATYVVDDDRIRIADIVGTERACEELVMEQQAFLYGVLADADTFTLEGRRLTILTADGRGIGLVAEQSE